MKTTDLWTVEWSHSQGAWHTDTLEDMLRRNLNNFVDKRDVDYYIVTFSTSQEGARKMIDELSAKMSKLYGKDWRKEFWKDIPEGCPTLADFAP